MESIPNRIIACRLLGQLCKKLDISVFDTKVMDLCHDSDYEVRSAMCRELATMAQAIGYVSMLFVYISLCVSVLLYSCVCVCVFVSAGEECMCMRVCV